MITLREIAIQLDVRQSTIKHFCNDFKINLLEHTYSKFRIDGDSVLHDELVSFLRKNQIFIKKYGLDYYSDKTASQIANIISRNEEDIHQYLYIKYPHCYEIRDGQLFRNLRYPFFRYISSFSIDFELGGDYSFLNTDLIFVSQKYNESITEELKNSENETNFNTIGYNDVFENIKELLEPIIHPQDITEWGLSNPGGIILFGPPGCGKTYWAYKISEIINYDFKEIPRSLFGSTYVDGAMMNLKNKIDEYSENPNTLIFFDEFDSVASSRNKQLNSSNENSKVVNTLLQEIPKLIEKRILIVAATNFLDAIDPAVIRPGRFDLKIPIFPPNPKERCQLICHYLLKDLSENSTLKKILIYNDAHLDIFWEKYTLKLSLYSNSLIVDFTQLIKKRIRTKFKEINSTEIKLDANLINEIINETSAKITAQDIECYSQFYNEVNKISSIVYSDRLRTLLNELSNYYGNDKNNAPRPIGFRNPRIE